MDGPSDRSRRVRKISPPPELDPRTVQLVASHFTELATEPTAPYLSHILKILILLFTMSYALKNSNFFLFILYYKLTKRTFV